MLSRVRVMPLRIITTEDVDLYRSIRLRALQADPDAFGSDYEREVAFDEETWVSRMTSFKDNPGVIFVEIPDIPSMAETSDGSVAAAVTGVGLLDDPTKALIWGMWVAPEVRRTGTARRLIDAALEWASSRSVEIVELDVMQTNTGAIALYESIGFVPVESPERAIDESCSDELHMELRLPQPSS